LSVAFVFPGQGSLRSAAGAAWSGAAADEVLATVTRGLGRDVRDVLADPTAPQRTADAQPAILAVSLLAWRAAVDAGLTPAFVAGHSLGEITAAVAGGSLSIEDAARVVGVRGRAMGDACRTEPGTMLALIRLDPDRVDTLIADIDDVVVANDNAPGQVVVAGSADGIARAGEAARDAGGRAMPIEVEGAFHSPAMRTAVAPVADALGSVELRDPEVPLVSGTTASPLHRAVDVERALVDGILAPVRWREVQLALAEAGVTTLVELGPGGVLKGLAKRTVRDLEVVTVAEPGDVERVTELLAHR
jgi:[acyl-carrier-protein] S-malonyltransferase